MLEETEAVKRFLEAKEAVLTLLAHEAVPNREPVNWLALITEAVIELETLKVFRAASLP